MLVLSWFNKAHRKSSTHIDTFHYGTTGSMLIGATVAGSNDANSILTGSLSVLANVSLLTFKPVLVVSSWVLGIAAPVTT